MATEVTVKLISLSLGKIQQSKQIKSGLNLRRSLLVASVLHKAKDIYMTEIKNRRADASSEQQQPKRPKFSSQRSLVESNSHSHTHYQSDSLSSSYSNETDSDNQISNDSPTEDEYEAETAAAAASISSDSILDELAAESESNKENSAPECSSTSDTGSIDSDILTSSRLESLSFKPCLKRRCSGYMDTETGGANDDSDSDSNCDAKRARVDHGHSAFESKKTGQINSLLHIFSSGLCTYSTSNDRSADVEDSDATSSCFTGHATNSTDVNTFSLCRESIALTA